MALYIIAQLVGLAGYWFYITAPHAKTQEKIISTEGIACVLLCVQWLCMGQLSLAVMNVLAIITALIALDARKHNRSYNALPLLYPIGFVAIWGLCDMTLIDILCLAAFFSTVASRCCTDTTHFRLYATLAGLLLIASGGLALSVPALIFNTLFTYGHAKALYEDHKWNTLGRALKQKTALMLQDSLVLQPLILETLRINNSKRQNSTK